MLKLKSLLGYFVLLNSCALMAVTFKNDDSNPVKVWVKRFQRKAGARDALISKMFPEYEKLESLKKTSFEKMTDYEKQSIEKDSKKTLEDLDKLEKEELANSERKLKEGLQHPTYGHITFSEEDIEKEKADTKKKYAEKKSLLLDYIKKQELENKYKNAGINDAKIIQQLDKDASEPKVIQKGKDVTINPDEFHVDTVVEFWVLENKDKDPKTDVFMFGPLTVNLDKDKKNTIYHVLDLLQPNTGTFTISSTWRSGRYFNVLANDKNKTNIADPSLNKYKNK